jgi:alkanesulfonate monooxygenase SsuD/methylene tetrahydromethanopterin reductase-like flavin-dependent oxidoreductase (luciferase family)
MKFGILHFFEHPAGGKTEQRLFKEQLDTLRAAEDMGFDAVWAPEHHFTEYGFCASPMLTLAAMTSVTKRIRLGSGVVVLPFNDPVRIAEEGAMIDLMSDGRLELGVGRGFQPVEFKGFGIDQASSGEVFEEALEIIQRAWTADAVRFEGKHFTVPAHAVRPRPLQKPHPPIWMAAVSEPSFEMAGRRGHNLLCSLVPGFKNEEMPRFLDTYENALRAAKHDASAREIGALCMVYCAETTAQARQDFGDPVLWYYRMLAKYVAPPGAETPAPGYEDYARIRHFAHTVRWDELLESGALICGNPDLCVAQIEKIRSRYGFTQLLCWTRLAGLEHRKVLASMDLFATRVLPHFKRDDSIVKTKQQMHSAN